MFNEINTYGEDVHLGKNTTSLRSEERHSIKAANITSSHMRKTMHVGATHLGVSPKNSRGLSGASPLNASGGGLRRSTHKSPKSSGRK